jgi:hypothetical protein
MRYAHLSLSRLRTALIGSGAGVLLIGTTLAAPALAADQQTTTQTTAAAQTPEALGRHTHQLHGLVKTTPASGATTFTLTTERFGDVTVAFAGTTRRGRGHGRGRARSFEVAAATDLKAGDRVVVQGRTSTSSDGKTVTFVARRVHVLPSKDARAQAIHLVGTIASVATSSSGTTLTLNTSQSVVVSSDTKIRPDGKTVADLTVGTKVTVVSKNGTATGVVILPA